MKRSILVFCLFCFTIGAAFAAENVEKTAHEEASAFPFILGVYGNADMNDLLNEDDIEYVRGIIEGKEKKTKFADANHDGVVDEADIVQIQHIMNGDECVLTVEDHIGRTVSINLPVKRIVSANTGCLRSLVALGALDRVVGISSETVSDTENLTITKVHPEILSFPQIGKYRELSFESVVELEPDVVFYAPWIDKESVDGIQERTGVPVISLGPLGNIFKERKGCYDAWRLAGIIVGEQERAEDLIRCCEELIGEIEAVTAGLSETEKPKVYYGGPLRGWVCTSYTPIDIAGGFNVGVEAMDGKKVNVFVPREHLIAWNPDFILIHRLRPDASIEETLSESTLQTITAVKNKNVYYIMDGTAGYDIGYAITMTVYLAKMFHPDKFQTLDVKETCDEILMDFYGEDNLFRYIEERGRGKLRSWE
jgi:iron complex transport system substrate-binding protein